jgi:hypothetical protein
MNERVRLPSALVRAAIAYGMAKGLDVSALLERLGLPQISPAGEPPLVTAQEARELLEEIARTLDEPLLGIQVAQSLERGTYGVVEFAARSAPDLRGAVDRVVRFISLLSAPAVAELADADGCKLLRFRFPGVRGTLGRHGNEFFATMMWLRSRELTGTSFRLRSVAFEHAAPPPPVKKDLEAFFELHAVGFDAEWNEIGLSDGDLSLPILSHEPHLLPLLDRMAEEEVTARAASRGLVDEVAHRVRSSLANGEPSLDEVARTLGMSGRTLQRRLNDEEKPFAEVVDSVRNELARIYVREPA